MKQLAIALFCVLSFLPVVAADESHNADVMTLTQEQKTAFLAQLKRENPHVSPNDTAWQRVQRNMELLCSDPLGFYTEAERGKLLLKHITNRDLSLDGKSIRDALGPQAVEMREYFELDQEKEIKEYRRSKRISEHPGLQNLYYLMSIYGFIDLPDYSTPLSCCVVQTMLGCWTT